MDATIKEILDKRALAEIIVNNCNKAIAALQELCDHDYIYTGHGHNKSYYECTKCVKRDWE